MAGNILCSSFVVFFLAIPQLCDSFLVKEQPIVLDYHRGALLKGNIAINLIWYGQFSPSQRSIVVDFIESLSSGGLAQAEPSVWSWWKTTSKYSSGGNPKSSPISSSLKVNQQIVLSDSTLGKALSSKDLESLASKVKSAPTAAINVVLTASDVTVEGFCMNRCGTHGSVRGSAFLWVGNSETQCPGYCAWPFQQPIYGPQTAALVAPNGDVGVDGMVITMGSLLANTVTNPFHGGYFQGAADAGLEAASACTGLFGSGSYPGYPGQLLTDTVSGASYNAYGVRGRKHLLPAMWDPQTSACKTVP